MSQLARSIQVLQEQPREGEATPDVFRRVCRAWQELCDHPCEGILAACRSWQQTCLSSRETHMQE